MALKESTDVVVLTHGQAGRAQQASGLIPPSLLSSRHRKGLWGRRDLGAAPPQQEFLMTLEHHTVQMFRVSCLTPPQGRGRGKEEAWEEVKL